jgi:hypothetical protein
VFLEDLLFYFLHQEGNIKISEFLFFKFVFASIAEIF